MKILITHPTAMGSACNAESLERLLRIAFTRYASFVRQISLQADKTTCTGSGPAFLVRIRVCLYRLPDVDVEEIQSRLELAIDRAIHRTDGLIRQQARRKSRNSARDQGVPSTG